MNIDWSKAPEGYDYHINWSDISAAVQSGFYREDGARYVREDGNYTTKNDLRLNGLKLTKRPSVAAETQAYTGEGLPPAVRLLREEALRVLEYKPETGMLIWKENNQRRFVGREAGSVNHHGYRRMHVLSTRIDAHRLIWLMHYGYLPDGEVDHINGNKLDNRLENLRLADQQKNQQNTGVRCDSRLGIKGVRIRPSGKYQARVKLTDGSRLVKSFDNLDSAVAWLSSARKESHGEFARDAAEQIAAEEREKAAEEMMDILSNARSDAKGAYDLYDAGYRKQEQK